MGFMGNAKGQLENNSSVTAFRVRCQEVDCEASKEFPPQSMTLVQKALEEAGWVYTPGEDVGEGPTMGYWSCGNCAAARQLTVDPPAADAPRLEEGTPAVTPEGEGDGDEGEGEGEKKEEDLTTE